MSIRLGISMTCLSFAKLLRMRKLFWIADAMGEWFTFPKSENDDSRPLAPLLTVRERTVDRGLYDPVAGQARRAYSTARKKERDRVHARTRANFTRVDSSPSGEGN